MCAFENVSGPVFRIGFSEFGDLVEELTGVHYSFVHDMESRNDCAHVFDVEQSPPDWELDRAQTWIESEGVDESFVAEALLCWMRQHGHIKEGLYIVDVCW